MQTALFLSRVLRERPHLWRRLLRSSAVPSLAQRCAWLHHYIFQQRILGHIRLIQMRFILLRHFHFTQGCGLGAEIPLAEALLLRLLLFTIPCSSFALLIAIQLHFHQRLILVIIHNMHRPFQIHFRKHSLRRRQRRQEKLQTLDTPNNRLEFLAFYPLQRTQHRHAHLRLRILRNSLL